MPILSETPRKALSTPRLTPHTCCRPTKAIPTILGGESGEIIQGDITKQRVDAIVNAANSTLLGGAGVDGAIHRAAGPQLLEECRALGGCPTGEARITGGYMLPAERVIHTVGPRWRGGGHGEDDLLAGCYRNSLGLASQNGLATVAFPAISTGAYGFPPEPATRIALRETATFLQGDLSIEKVLFVCFGKRDYETYRAVFEELVRNL